MSLLSTLLLEVARRGQFDRPLAFPSALLYNASGSLIVAGAIEGGTADAACDFSGDVPQGV